MLWTVRKYADETCVEEVRVPIFEACEIISQWTKEYMELGRFDAIYIFQEDTQPIGKWILL